MDVVGRTGVQWGGQGWCSGVLAWSAVCLSLVPNSLPQVVLIVISVLESLIAFLPILWNRSIASRLIRPFFFVGLSSRLRLRSYLDLTLLSPLIQLALRPPLS